VAAVAGYVAVYACGLAGPPIRSDGFSYHVYLPSWFLFHDPTLEALSQDCCGGRFPQFSGIFRWPGTGQWMNPHPMGVAVLATPFFLAAHLLTRWSNLSPDGFSLYYQLLTPVAGVFYLVLGLAFLRRALERRFSAGVTLQALVVLTWGTNLFHYGTYDSLFSHVFSFCLFAALLLVTPPWLSRPSLERSVALGAVAGLVVLTRHTDVLLLLFPALYGITGMRTLRERAAFLRANWGPVLAVFATTAVLLAPQVALYHRATGSWLVSPYGSLGSFHFASPRILDVLASPQKGLFFWSPVLLLAVAGFFHLPARAPEIVLPLVVVLPLEVFLVASWSDWQLGGSFGHRAFTDLLPAFAFGIAALLARVRRTRMAPVVGTVAALLVALSVVQMTQYWLRIIPSKDTSWELYRSVFLRLGR
jgi:hypothetical protein